MVAQERLICASVDLVERGDGVRFTIERHGRTLPAFVVRYAGMPRAYLNQCAHVPVELDWTPGRFFDSGGLYLICAVHGALYDPASGRCAGGRCAGRNLRALAVEEHDGAVYLMEETGNVRLVFTLPG